MNVAPGPSRFVAPIARLICAATLAVDASSHASLRDCADRPSARTDAALTLTEALAFLTAATAHHWNQYEFFCLLTHCRMGLHAKVPAHATTVVREAGARGHAPGRGALVGGRYALAVVFPFQVLELWRSGATATEQPLFEPGEGGMEWFTEPVPVTFASVRVRRATLADILQLWKTAKHSLVHRSDLPDWVSMVAQETLGACAVTDRKALVLARKVARRLVLARPLRGLVVASLPYVGPVASTQELQPRILWLMAHYFQTQADWFHRTRRALCKSDIERQVFIRLAHDGTRGERHAKVGEATIHRLAESWLLPNATLLPV